MNKQVLLLLMIFLTTFIPVACGPAPLEDASESYKQPEPSIDTMNVDTSKEASEEIPEDYNKIFELNLFSDKTIYKTTENIKIWATLKYIGSNSQVKIWHGLPYINFGISDGKEFNIGTAVASILTSTLLEKDKLYSYDYVKSGGYSADDPKADFWKAFYEEKDLYLPEGNYTITVGGAFSLTDNSANSNLSKIINITVVK